MRLLIGVALCSSGFGAAAPTYADIQPILERRCTACHRAGEIAPMKFTSYQETRPWAAAIKQAVLRGSMPPWHADAETSKRIHNARLLSAEEIQQLAAWADNGAREGKPVSSSKPAGSHSGWTLGTPDLIVRIPGYKVPEQATLQYTFLVTPTEFAEDRWITAAEWKIDQRSVVHHMNAFIRPPGSSYVKTATPGTLYVATKEERAARRQEEREVDRRELLLGYEPGYRPISWGPDHGKLLRKGSDIVFEIHYSTNGKAVTDHSELGIYFAKQRPPRRVFTITPADAQLAIPPGDSNYRSFVTATLKTPATLFSMQPHMHLRGKAYRIDAVFPGGRRETLLHVPRYDFNWQTTYFLKSPMELPAGTKLECTAWFDNSANNKANPDPGKTIYWGDQSWEEMNIGFMEIAFASNADPHIVTLSGTTRPSPGGGAR